MALITISERHKINLVSLLVTLGVIFVAIQVSDGSFATRINKISENLDKALTEIIDQRRPNFTDLPDNAKYVSDQFFNPRGMAGLYNITNSFMDLILPKEIYPKDFLSVENNQIKFGDYQKEWKSLLKKYSGLLTLLIILALLIVLMPLTGFFFCCCRCCGKCGSRSQPFDKKHDLCKKIVLATLLIGLGTLLLFGVVCAFVSTQHMQEGVNNLTNELNGSIKDVNTYLDTTDEQLNTLLNTNYEEFQTVLVDTIVDSSNIVYAELSSYSNAVSLTQLAKLVSILPQIKDNFVTLKYSTNALRVWAPQLNDAVRKIKKDLLSTLKLPACDNVPDCAAVRNNISSLDTKIHFNNLPDISDNLQLLDDLLQNGDLYTNAVLEGQRKLENVKDSIAAIVNSTMRQARRKIDEAGNEIRKGSQDITALIHDLKSKINENSKPALKDADHYINTYYPYVYYVCLTLSCVLLAIAVCVVFGLICGICGKRPDGYGDDCCNKGTGSSFLICGVMLMFIACAVFGLVILAASMTGIVAQRLFCDSLRAPNDSQIFDLINKFNFSENHINLNIGDALHACHKNESIYEVFNLKEQFDLEEVKDYMAKFDIDDILAQLNISNQIPPDFTLISDANMDVIRNLGESSFADVNFYEFTEQLNGSFTTANLTLLSNELRKVIEKLDNPNDPDSSEIVTSLKLSTISIDAYQEKLVDPMMENATAVVSIVTSVQNDLKGNKSTFKEAIDAILDEIENAEQTLKVNGTAILNNITINFTSVLTDQIQTYLDRVYYKTKDDVGKCAPLSLVINATLTSTCDKILLPLNGFWFGLFWSVLIFIPIIIVSVKLATLYQKYSPYSGPLVEAEYLCDAYAERDNIPLSSRNGKVKKKGKKYKRYEDRPLPSAGGDMVTREYAAGSHHQDQRYADMAPKHWEDFPAGGPPQYQRAPTEYERPPPYYYPGAAAESHP